MPVGVLRPRPAGRTASNVHAAENIQSINGLGTRPRGSPQACQQNLWVTRAPGADPRSHKKGRRSAFPCFSNLRRLTSPRRSTAAAYKPHPVSADQQQPSPLTAAPADFGERLALRAYFLWASRGEEAFSPASSVYQFRSANLVIVPAYAQLPGA